MIKAMKIEKVVEFARKQGYDNVKPLEKWKGYDVYEPIFDGEEVSFVGMPLLILVKDDKIRMSTADEALQQIDDL